MKIFKSTDQSGQVMVIVGIVLIVMVVLVGLAIDSGRAYSVKAKLNAALDAAGIAAARAVGDGTQEAIDAATTFFNSNYPAEYMQSTPSFCPPNGVPNINTDPNTGDTTITVWATADMPTMFMRVVGQDTVDVAATTTATRRAVDLSFVVDNTGSLSGSGDNVIDRSIDFVNHFHPNFDRLALIKYAYGAEVPVPIRTDSRGFPLSTVETEIGNFTFSGYTNCAEGFWQGKNQLDSVTSQSNLRVIVFFTDGSPNTISSYFEFDTANPRRGSIRSGDGSSGRPRGLYRHNRIAQQIPSPYNFGTTIDEHLSGLPDFYNAHTTDLDSDPAVYTEDPDDADYHKFRVITGDAGVLFDNDSIDPPLLLPGTRLVEQYEGTGEPDLFERVNNASRNLLEAMAKEARSDGIYVYTLGLGYRLQNGSGPNDEPGEVILLRMANDENADIRFDDEPQGVYCYAADDDALGPCFNKIVEAIIRLTI